MTTVHAYRRSAPISVDLFEQTIEFKPNANGEIVAELDAGPALDRLLEITEGYRVLGAAPVIEPDADEETVIETSPYVLTQEKDDGSGDEETIDLRTLARKELVQFCEDNEIPAPNKNDNADAIRDKIVAFFKVE